MWQVLGRVVTVRTVLVRYSLIQQMSGKGRLSYKGFKVKHIRAAVQCLIIILLT